MLSISLRHLRAVIACVLALTLCVQPAMAQSVLRDAETEAFFEEISAPLIRAAGLDPANVDIVLINDRSINAFVAGGQAIYIHTGLIEAVLAQCAARGLTLGFAESCTGGLVGALVKRQFADLDTSDWANGVRSIVGDRR